MRALPRHRATQRLLRRDTLGVAELAADGGGTRLTITEDGEVYNPLFRFVSRFIMGHTSSIDRYLADVQKALTR